MKQIILKNGPICLVDDSDFEWLSAHVWTARPSRAGPYAFRRENQKLFLMHREIMGAKKGEIIDHKDGDGLNNQRDNLRIVTHGQNMLNCRKTRPFSSPYKGVYFDKDGNNYRAEINLNKKRVRLGRFKDARNAALAYDEAALELHGEFARTNKSLGLL